MQKEIYNNNFKNQHFDGQIPTNIPCQTHKGFVTIAIQLQEQQEGKLVCSKCIRENKLNHEQYIIIQEIFQENPNNIIENWPPLQDNSIYQKILSDDVLKSYRNQLIQEVDQFFYIFPSQILLLIDNIHKKLITHINQTDEKRQNLFNVYNQISNIEELKDEIQKNNNQLKLEQYFQQLIKKKYSQSYENQQHIQNSFEDFNKYHQKFNFNYIKDIFQNYLNRLESIDVLNPLLPIEQQFKSKYSDKQKSKDEENTLEKKVDKIMNLINNKSNFCNERFLKNMKDTLMMNKEILIDIDLNNPYLEEKQPIQFQCLKQNDLQYLANIVECIKNENLNQVYQKNEIFGQVLMSTSQLFKQIESKIAKEINQNRVQNAQRIENQQQLHRFIEVNDINSNESMNINNSNDLQPGNNINNNENLQIFQ